MTHLPDAQEYELEAKWKEEVYYWEGDRGFLFDAGWGAVPPVLYVPSAEDWDASTPPWMHGRREVIVARLEGFARHRIEVGPYPASARGLTR